MDYYVYVLKSLKTGILYKGSTQNIDRRLRQHLVGSCQTTRHLRPLILVFVQVCNTRIEARTLEKYLKSGIGREILKAIVLEQN